MNLVWALNNLVNRNFLMNPYGAYKFFYNSSMNKRGTGILVKNDIPFLELRREEDPDENFLILRAEIKGTVLTIGSIYGPNSHDRTFFTKLNNAVQILGCDNVILGGDWNCSYSTDPIVDNIDCLNMANTPNARHSVYVTELCHSLNLMDPYRGFFPNRRDYTYISRNELNKNKSRIDFFLVSLNIFPSAVKCDIVPHLQSKMFDHRAIMLDFYPPPKNCNIRGPMISNMILKDPDIDIVVFTATLECYIIHLHIERTPLAALGRENILQDIGNVWTKLKVAGPDPNYFLEDDIADEYKLNREHRLQEINLILNRFDMVAIQEYPLLIDCDIFMETLLSCIKNAVSSYQHFISKTKGAKKLKILDRIAAMKKDPNHNQAALSIAERELDKIIDQEVRIAVEKSPLFDHINNEKMSPLFLKLAKSCNSEYRLNDIVGSDGVIFNCEADRNEYIVSYFEKIYKKPDYTPDNVAGIIENFLGPDILSNPTVLASKLSARDSAILDRELSINELDSSIEQANLRSAGGADGLNNTFLKKFWRFLRVPLHKYSVHCFRMGKLTNSFRSGTIKLIPKKGDATNIKNWRPISLLNCVYKVISRAIKNRLDTVSDKLTSRAQKGFTGSRVLQEALINIIENIAFCKSNNVAGTVLAIDQAKAFDSLSHAFMKETYKFFGFGEGFINMLTTLSFERTSCILMEDSSYSRSFNIETGTLQGDSPSPILFNICEQILLFKIEFDPAIKSIFFGFDIPRPIFPSFNINAATEANRESDKVDAYADDTTVCTITEIGSLSAIKNILTDFGNFSGLKCNFDKTSIMLVGDREAVTNEILELGFPMVNSVKILGLEIDFDLRMLDTVHDKTIGKIRNIINFWHRFNLSLPGRISIAKTLLFSQINFLGCIIMPTEVQVTSMQNLIDEFVTKNLNVSKSRIYISTKNGGLGCFKIKEFLSAQHVIWIKKAFLFSKDNWSYDLKKLCHGNPIAISTQLVDENRHPILYTLAKSFDSFKIALTSLNENYLRSLLINNPCFKRSRFDNRFLDDNFFRQNPPLDLRKVYKLTFEQVANKIGMRRLDEINEQFDLNLNLLTYMRLGEAVTFFLRNNNVNANEDDSSFSMGSFLSSFKKGSRPIRRVLANFNLKKFNLDKQPHVAQFFRIIGVNVVENKLLKTWLGFWSQNMLPNRLKEFIFKFNSNILGTNVRISHFVQNIRRDCTFCSLKNLHPCPEENFEHLFFSCNTTDDYLRRFEREFLPDFNFPDIASRKTFWFLCILPDDKEYDIFLATVIWTFKFVIWERKLKKRLPSFLTLKVEFFIIMIGILSVSSFLRNHKNNAVHFICRNWDNIRV